MGLTRNGARSFLNVIAKACKLSHMSGFVTGLNSILGPENAAQVYALWTPLCALVETLIAADNYFNQVDFIDEEGDTEDIGGA